MKARLTWLGCLWLAICAECNAEALPQRSEALAGKVGLNHFYVVLDEASFAAARDSEWLKREFASVDTGLPKFEAPQADSQRLYIRGQTTYVELLGPQNPFKEPVGKIGIALGVDEWPLLDDVQAAWSASLGSNAERYQIEWKRTTPPVPWYDVIQHRTTSDNPELVLWVSAYRQEFLPWLYPQRSAHENRGSRADFLAPLFQPERLVRDVTGLTIAVSEPLRQQIAGQLEAVGYRRVARGETLDLHGNGWTLTLVAPNADRRGLLSITLATRAAEKANIPLGPRSVMKSEAQSTQWTFK